LSVVVHYRNRK